MNPSPPRVPSLPTAAAPPMWPHARWRLAALLAGLGTLGPFAIDTYLPAFAGIAQALQASPAQMQQTLAAYLVGFAVMNLFHGALADVLGRRPVVLAGLALFTLASLGCALAGSIGQLVGFRVLQGMSAGAGMVVSRAIVRDLYPQAEAQKVMSMITIFFGLAPAVAPMFGGLLFVHLGWRAVFGLLVLIGLALLATNLVWLPETLPKAARQSFHPLSLLKGYRGLLGQRRFMLLVLASGIPFNGMFLYVLSAPAWLGEVLGLRPTQFFVFFLSTIAGITGGAALSGRLAGRMRAAQQVRWGLAVMVLATAANLALNLGGAPPAWAAIAPVALFAFGWSLMVPVITLMALDCAPTRRGMASSLQACVGSLANAAVAGVLAPMVMHSAPRLAWASAALLSVGLVAWWALGRLGPPPGQAVAPG